MIKECLYCKSKEVVKRGYFEAKAHGKRQRYFCKSCGKRFIEKDAFYRMRNTPQKITLCLDLFYKGVSTRKIQEHLQAFYPHNSSNVSIYSWIIKYSEMISKFTDKIKLGISSEVQIDEVEYHRRKSNKHKGIEENWFIDSICPRTKFMVASSYFKARGQEEIKQIVKAIKSRVENDIFTITTDGLQAYPKVIKSVFGYSKSEKKFNTFHNVVNASKGEGFNHPIERLHNTIRARTKIMRGFHGSLESANAIMKGFEIYYNFINKHQAINRSPYELATDLKLTQDNKWLELIKLSKT